MGRRHIPLKQRRSGVTRALPVFGVFGSLLHGRKMVRTRQESNNIIIQSHVVQMYPCHRTAIQDAVYI